jgi:uridine kinase
VTAITGEDPRESASEASVAVVEPEAMAALVIGIAGGSGSGKTTIARKIAELLPPEGVGIIEHDAYYRDRHGPQIRGALPAQLRSPGVAGDGAAGRAAHRPQGRHRVAVPVYDFKTHRRTEEPRWVEASPVIIVEGILTLVDARLRAELDIKVFVDTDPDIRIFRRIRRDIEQRGRTFESVREQYYRHVRPMHLQFVEPSKRRAEKITMTSEGLPDHPIIPFIEGDGTGPDIWARRSACSTPRSSKPTAASARSSGKRSSPARRPSSRPASGCRGDPRRVPQLLVGIKGPLTTPVGGGIRSLNVALRQSSTSTCACARSAGTSRACRAR